MTELSPAALKIRDAAEKESDLDFRYAPQIAAAAIEALADQIVPAADLPQRSDFSDRSVYQWAVDVHAYDDATRRKILAIAAELRGTSTHVIGTH